MSEMTYTRCLVCKGSLKRRIMVSVSDCPCTTTSTPGWAATGLTMGQLSNAWRTWNGRCAVILECPRSNAT